jgi:hypothetical protein
VIGSQWQWGLPTQDRPFVLSWPFWNVASCHPHTSLNPFLNPLMEAHSPTTWGPEKRAKFEVISVCAGSSEKQQA